MRELNESELGEIAKIQTGPFGSQLLNEQYITGGTPIITVEHIKDFEISKLDYPSVTEEDRLRLDRYSLKEGDIVFSRVGSVDLSAITRKENDGWLFSSRMLRVRPNLRIIDPYFLAYYFRLYSVRKYINNVAVGSTMPSINTSILKTIPVKFPEKQIQTQIAKTLSVLDNKITLLRQQNETLEGLAQLLFKRWFVEKLNEDWKIYELNEITDVGIGRTPPRKDPEWFSTSQENVKWISIKDMGNDGVFMFETSEYLTREAIEKFNIPVIPKDTVILSFKMTLGRIGITSEEMLSNEAIAHFKFTPNTPITKEYLYLYLKNYRFENLGSTSSIVTSINSSMIRSMEIPVPDKKTMNEFQDVSEKIFKKIRTNQKEIQTLTNLRDTLLPKLMRGEVRISP